MTTRLTRNALVGVAAAAAIGTGAVWLTLGQRTNNVVDGNNATDSGVQQIEVKVTSMSGEQFSIKLFPGEQLSAVKEELERLQGTPRHCQMLYRVREQEPEDQEEHEMLLADSDPITQPCTLLLCVGFQAADHFDRTGSGAAAALAASPLGGWLAGALLRWASWAGGAPALEGVTVVPGSGRSSVVFAKCTGAACLNGCMTAKAQAFLAAQGALPFASAPAAVVGGFTFGVYDNGNGAFDHADDGVVEEEEEEDGWGAARRSRPGLLHQQSSGRLAETFKRVYTAVLRVDRCARGGAVGVGVCEAGWDLARFPDCGVESDWWDDEGEGEGEGEGGTGREQEKEDPKNEVEERGTEQQSQEWARRGRAWGARWVCPYDDADRTSGGGSGSGSGSSSRDVACGAVVLLEFDARAGELRWWVDGVEQPPTSQWHAGAAAARGYVYGRGRGDGGGRAGAGAGYHHHHHCRRRRVPRGACARGVHFCVAAYDAQVSALRGGAADAALAEVAARVLPFPLSDDDLGSDFVYESDGQDEDEDGGGEEWRRGRGPGL